MRRRLPIEDAVSAGGVVWRNSGHGVEIALCGRHSDDSWVLPKGTPDGDETLEQTALREVREETGLQVKASEPLMTIDYWFTLNGVRYHKLVHHWLMEAVGGDVSDHDHEFDEVRWMPLADAIHRVAYDNQRIVLKDAARALGVEV